MDTILLTGKTRLFSTETLKHLYKTHRVLVTGREQDSGGTAGGNIHYFPSVSSEEDFQRIFDTGRIRAVWHVTGCADGGNPSDERAQIENTLELCSRNGVDRMFVLTEGNDPTDYGTLIRSWSAPVAGKAPVSVVVVNLPLLIGTETADSRTGSLFSVLLANRKVILEGSEETPISVMSTRKLGTLLLRMTSETWVRPGFYLAADNAGTLADLRNALSSVHKDAVVLFSRDTAGRPTTDADSPNYVIFRLPVMPSAKNTDGFLSEIYRFPVKADWKKDFADEYGRMQADLSGMGTSGRKIPGFLRQFGGIAVAAADLIVMFIVSEYLAKITSGSVYFKVVDVRVLYVVMMGLTHGLITGTTAAVLECVMLIRRYTEVGISGLLLFYNVENWIPFVFYLTAGVISGYTHQKNVQKVRSVSAENNLIRNKYLFLNEAYKECVRDKKELRAQVLSEDQSYGKLYDAVRRMSQRTPEAVCVEAINVFRHILDNSTIAFYQVDSKRGSAGLLSCCRDSNARKDIRISRFPELMETVEKGGVWKNVSLIEDAPMYASMVSFDRVMQPRSGAGTRIRLLVTIDQASAEQQSLWYVNHFSIMCGLLQDALDHASLRERILK